MGFILVPMMAVHFALFTLAPLLLWMFIRGMNPARTKVPVAKAVSVALAVAIGSFALRNGPALLSYLGKSRVDQLGVMYDTLVNPLNLVVLAATALLMRMAARSPQPLHRPAMHGAVFSLALQPLWVWGIVKVV